MSETNNDVHFWLMAMGDCRAGATALTEDEVRCLTQSSNKHFAKVNFLNGFAYVSPEAIVQAGIQPIAGSLPDHMPYTRMSSVTRLLSREVGERLGFPSRDPLPSDFLVTNNALVEYYYERALKLFVKIADAAGGGTNNLLLTDPVIVHALFSSLQPETTETFPLHGDILHLTFGFHEGERGFVAAELLHAPPPPVVTKRR